MVVAAPSAASGAPSEASEGAVGPHSQEAQAAKAAYAAGRYADAARSFQAAWRRYAWVGALYNAGMAWDAAGEHDALAIAAWRAYLAASEAVVKEERLDLERRIERALARTGTLKIRYRGASAARPTRLILHREGDPGADLVEIEVPAGEAAEAEAELAEVPVDPGAWVVAGRGERAEVVGRAQVEVNLTQDVLLEGREPDVPREALLPPPERVPAAREGPASPLEANREAARLRRLRLSLGVGLGVAGVGLAASGAAIWPYGAQGRYKAWIGGEAGAARLVEAEHTRQLASVSLLGAGVGVWFGAATAAGGALAPRKVLFQAAVGGGVAVGGALLQVSAVRCTQAAQELGDFGSCRGRDFTGGALLGVGGGLLGASLVTLVAGVVTRLEPGRRAGRARHERPGLSVQAGPTGAGVLVGGSF
ncbi:MAG: hypothetical protein IPK80_36155 [Nannocystis sp.]|nr:hypothetical protein [Nannocystis sp.]